MVPLNVVGPRWAPAPRPAIAQTAAPAMPEPPKGVPAMAVNLAIMAGGLGIGLLGFKYRKYPLGAIAVGMGGSVAGVGFIFVVLDLFGFSKQI